MGRRLAGRLAKDGHRVLATDRDGAALDAAAAADGWATTVGACVPHGLDVTDRAGWARALQTADALWGGVDVLLNVAGVLVPRRIQDAEPREIDLQIDAMKRRRIFKLVGRRLDPLG